MTEGTLNFEPTRFLEMNTESVHKIVYIKIKFCDIGKKVFKFRTIF